MTTEGQNELVHRYLLLSEFTRDIVLFVARDGAILEGNRAAEAAYGYTRAELQTLNIADLRDSRTHWQVPHQMAAAHQHGITFETWHRRRDGRIFPVEVSSVSSDYQGQRILLSVVRDITQRKRREAIRSLIYEMDRRVLQSESPSEILPDICDQLAATFDLALVRIGLKEPDGSVRMIATGGRLTQGFIDLPVRWDQAPFGMGPTGAAMRTGRLQRSRLDDASFPLIWQNQIRENGLREAVALPITGEGRVLGALTLYAAMDNLFDSETLEHLHHFANQAAITLVSMERQQQLNLQRVALEAAANAVVITDRSGVIRWVNPAFTTVTGYTAAEAIGQNPRILNSGHHSRAFFTQLWRTILSGGTWEGEIINRKKDGNLYVDQMIITPVRDKSGEISHFVVIKQELRSAVDDPRANLMNRSAFVRELESACAGAAGATDTCLVLAALDQPAAAPSAEGPVDIAMLELSRQISQAIGPNGCGARLGEDRFVILLRGTTPQGVAAVIERLRRAAETLRIGTVWTNGSQSATELLAAAEMAVRGEIRTGSPEARRRWQPSPHPREPEVTSPTHPGRGGS